MLRGKSCIAYVLLLNIIVIAALLFNCNLFDKPSVRRLIAYGTARTVVLSVNDEAMVKETEGVCYKGTPEITRDYMLSEFQPFLDVFNRRPEAENHDGTGFHHQFALWCVIRQLKPLHIIESGVHFGYGTWLLRQAAPMAQLIMLDPVNKKLKYTDTMKNTIYLRGTEFRDFYKIDWVKEFGINLKRTLMFFDDHINGVDRLIAAWKAGFVHLMFDDNYAPGRGDNFSIKMACAVLHNLTSKRRFRIPNSSHRRITMEEAVNKSETVFHDMIKTYLEFPSIWKSPAPYFASNQNYIFNVSGIDGALKSYKLENRPTKHGQMYFNICYLELKN